MGTKKNPGLYDCYKNAAEDEPMFVLLGRDASASLIVDIWANVREARGDDAGKVAEARACAIEMRAYALARGKAPNLQEAIEAVKRLAETLP